MDVAKNKSAKQMFDCICRYFDGIDWKYQKDDEKKIVKFGVNGNDFEMNFLWLVDEERQLIRIISTLPFKMSEEKRVEGAVLTSYINYKTVNGSFDFDITDGTIMFRMAQSFWGSILGDDVFGYLNHCSIQTVEEYNDMLFMLSKGMMSVEDCIKKINE